MSWIDYIPMGIWLFVVFFGYVGTIVCFVREQRAWKRQKIKDLSATPEKKAEDQCYGMEIKKG